MKKILFIVISLSVCVSSAYAFKPANRWKYASRSGNLYMVSQGKTFWLYGLMMQSGTGAAELLVSGSTFWLDSPDTKSWGQTFDPPIAFDEGTVFSCDIFQGSILIWGYEGDTNDDAGLIPQSDDDVTGSIEPIFDDMVSQAE
ncbi:hypothetical protein JXB22_09940 [candidate division WOR-3 bacterium]|nr:hypothetical protein [candidate division WOR-3 bacterium]